MRCDRDRPCSKNSFIPICMRWWWRRRAWGIESVITDSLWLDAQLNGGQMNSPLTAKNRSHPTSQQHEPLVKWLAGMFFVRGTHQPSKVVMHVRKFISSLQRVFSQANSMQEWPQRKINNLNARSEKADTPDETCFLIMFYSLHYRNCTFQSIFRYIQMYSDEFSQDFTKLWFWKLGMIYFCILCIRKPSIGLSEYTFWEYSKNTPELHMPI